MNIINDRFEEKPQGVYLLEAFLFWKILSVDLRYFF